VHDTVKEKREPPPPRGLGDRGRRARLLPLSAGPRSVTWAGGPPPEEPERTGAPPPFSLPQSVAESTPGVEQLPPPAGR
jgi:hypothetical protein